MLKSDISSKRAQDEHRRAEIYALNDRLKNIEIEAFEAFKREQQGRPLEEIQWDSDDSSEGPSPRVKTNSLKLKASGKVIMSRSDGMKASTVKRDDSRTTQQFGGV